MNKQQFKGSIIKTVILKCQDCGTIVKKESNNSYVQTSIGRCPNCNGLKLRLSLEYTDDEGNNLQEKE